MSRHEKKKLLKLPRKTIILVETSPGGSMTIRMSVTIGNLVEDHSE